MLQILQKFPQHPNNKAISGPEPINRKRESIKIFSVPQKQTKQKKGKERIETLHTIIKWVKKGIGMNNNNNDIILTVLC